MISLDRLFSMMMAERSLLVRIGNNIGGGSQPAADAAPAAGVAPPQEGASGSEPMPTDWSQDFSRRQQSGLVSHSLLGLRPAMPGAIATPGAGTFPLPAPAPDASSPDAAHSFGPGASLPAAPSASSAGGSTLAATAAAMANASDQTALSEQIHTAGSDEAAVASGRGRPEDVLRAMAARSEARTAHQVASATTDARELSGAGRAREATGPGQTPIATMRLSVDPQAASTAQQADGLRHGIDVWATPLVSGAAMERAGIIASCILNAAMIPGWPAPRPFELAAGRALVPERLPPGAPIDENEALNYLAGIGASRSLLDRIRELTRSVVRRLKLLLGLAVLATLMTEALRTLQDELTALAEELEAAEAEELVGGRRHIAS
jgi:hypothetical protein